MGAFPGFSKGSSQCRAETQSHLSQEPFGNVTENSWRRDCLDGSPGIGTCPDAVGRGQDWEGWGGETRNVPECSSMTGP